MMLSRRLPGLSASKAKGATETVTAVDDQNSTSSQNPVDNQNPHQRVLRENDPNNLHVLGLSFSKKKKWLILSSVFIVQISMNFNAGIFGNAGEGMAEEFGVKMSTIKIAQMLFLVMYAFGCEAWAPFSEELGRKWVMQGSLGLVNLWAMACAVSPNFGCIMAFRALGGLSSAGGSVTLGMVADLWEPETQQEALAFVVFSSCAGSVVGAIAGGFLEQYCNWRWIFWAQLIFGAFAQAIHIFVPETRSSVLLDRHAQHLRKTNQDPNACGPRELQGSFWQRLSFKKLATLMWRPYKLLITEPIVLLLSLLSGFSDALIFTAFDSFGMVLGLWNFSKMAIGLSFISILLGNIIAWASFLPVYWRDQKAMRKDPASFAPERRLWWLLFLVVLEPIGLVGFGFGSNGPPDMHWIVPLIFACLIGIANYAIYMATIDYMVAAYGAEAGASATGGNGFCRDFLAGMAALYTKSFYADIKTGTKFQLPIPTWILSGVAVLLCVPVYVFYFEGEWFRKRSPYAQQLAREREEAPKACIEMAPISRAPSVEIVEA